MANYHKHDQSTRKYRYDLHDRVAVGASTAWSAEISDAIEVMLCPTTDCHVTVAATNDVAADPATNAFPLLAGEKFHLQLVPGDHVAVIRDTANGFLVILPVDGRDQN